MPHPVHAGSKRKFRAYQREKRRRDALNDRLNRIKAYAELLETPHELECFLAQIPDEAKRDETRKLILSFCSFDPAAPKVVLAGEADLEDALADAAAVVQ